jgi:hypothetical protein
MSIESRHTPGPWKWNGQAAIWANSTCVCTFKHHDVDDDCFSPVIGPNGAGQSVEQAKANARLISAAPDLLEAALVQHACGEPEKVSMYDEEGVEGWRWAHPDGREWFEMGSWDEPPPMHPMMAEAIAKATGSQP